MKRKNRIYLACLIIFIGGWLFYRYGRSVWGPLKLRVLGKKTVKEVLKDIEPRVNRKYKNIGELINKKPLSLLVFKEERKIELWKMKSAKRVHIKTFKFTGFSGTLGPKLREGDGQIPEGIYNIEYLNPNSSYYLSFKINYPNNYDRDKAAADNRNDLGGDIFIHGEYVTIGCVPIGNVSIEDLFYIVTKNGIKNTQIIISPYDMRKKSRELDISGIDWEHELYSILKNALAPFKK